MSKIINTIPEQLEGKSLTYDEVEQAFKATAAVLPSPSFLISHRKSNSILCVHVKFITTKKEVKFILATCLSKDMIKRADDFRLVHHIAEELVYTRFVDKELPQLLIDTFVPEEARVEYEVCNLNEYKPIMDTF